MCPVDRLSTTIYDLGAFRLIVNRLFAFFLSSIPFHLCKATILVIKGQGRIYNNARVIKVDDPHL